MMDDNSFDDKVVIWFCVVGAILTAIGIAFFVKLFKQDKEQLEKLQSENK